MFAVFSILVLARDKAGESFDQLLGEHNSRQLPPEVGALMLESADHALVVADSLQVALELGCAAGGCGDGVQRLDGGAAALVASWFMIAERIEGVDSARQFQSLTSSCGRQLLTAWQSGTTKARSVGRPESAWPGREWIEHLGDLVHDLDEAAARVAASAAAPWWR